MSYKRLAAFTGFAILAFSFFAIPASASMISISIVETGTGVYERSSSDQFSDLWENGLMTAFFDAGYIVTSSPVTRIQNVSASDMNASSRGPFGETFDDALSAGAVYYILGLLNYNGSSSRTATPAIVLKVYELDSRRLIFEQALPPGAGRSAGDELQLATNVGRNIVSHIRNR